MLKMKKSVEEALLLNFKRMRGEDEQDDDDNDDTEGRTDFAGLEE